VNVRSAWSGLALLVALAWLAPSAAAAQADQAYRAASEAERDGDPAAALEAWREVLALAPGSRMAARAERRRRWLEDRAEDGFGPLRALLAFQRGEAPDPAAFAAIVDGMPPGRVRVESLLALAAAWRGAGAHGEAVSCYRRVLAEPAVRGDEATLARDELAGALAEGGDLDAALAELESAGMHEAARHGALLRARRRVWLEPLAWAALVLFAGLSASVLGRGRPRDALAALREPAVTGLAALVGLGPIALSRFADDEAHEAFVVFGAANALVLVLAFAVSRSLGPAAPRGLVSLLGASLVVAVAAAGYLSVLYRGPSLPFT
jgi:hypothetical protein